MIPISAIFCLACGTRFETTPQYCPNELVIGDSLPRRCPGPVVQVFADEPPPPRLADVDLEDLEEAA